jgi:hypothetical protein
LHLERTREGLCLHRPLLCNRRILVLCRRPSLCCRPRPLRLWTLRLPRRRRAPVMTTNSGEELPGRSRQSRGGWNGVRADKSCSVSCGRFVLPRRALLLLPRTLPRFFPARGVRAIPSFPARKPHASRSRKPRVFHRRTSFF